MTVKYRNKVIITSAEYDHNKYRELSRKINFINREYETKIISLFYNLNSFREQVMFYLEPMLGHLIIATEFAQNQLTLAEYKSKANTYQSKIGPNVFGFHDLWNIPIEEEQKAYKLVLESDQKDLEKNAEELSKLARYYMFRAAMSELGWYFEDHATTIEATEEELAESGLLSDTTFTEKTKTMTSKAQKALEYTLKDYKIKLEDIPKTIGD